MLATVPSTPTTNFRRNIFGVWLLVAVLCMPTLSAFAASAPNEDVLKAAFVFNFAQFTRWPAVQANAVPIKFCLYGDSLDEEARTTLAGKVIGGRRTIVEVFTADGIPRGCSVLYIAQEQGPELACAIGVRAANLGILTVSDLDGFEACGGHINITTINNRLRFVVNLQRVQQNNLALSAQLLELAIIRNTPP